MYKLKSHTTCYIEDSISYTKLRKYTLFYYDYYYTNFIHFL